MNAFVKKEVRLLRPLFAVVCLLAFSNWLPADSDSARGLIFNLVPNFLCPVVMVLLVLNSFGAEFSAGTFSHLLAQPVSRQKLWDTKISLLAAAVLILGALRVFSSWWYAGTHPGTGFHAPPDWREDFIQVMFFQCAIFSGGLWSVLLFRQMAAAFWFTLLLPGVLAIIFNVLPLASDPDWFRGMTVTGLGLYSLAGFLFARWLFFRAQDVQWAGGNIVMPELGWTKAAASLRRSRPHAALWRKELHLQQSQLVIAAVFLLLHLGVLAVRNFSSIKPQSELGFVLRNFCGLWLVMPLLVGCAAVAEERKLGTLGGQLCLPVRTRTQWRIKLMTVLGLSLLLGMVVPLALEGTKILPTEIKWAVSRLDGMGAKAGNWESLMPPVQHGIWWGLLLLDHYLALVLMAGIAAGIGLLSFYASSLTRNTLQALAPAALGVLAAAVLMVIGGNLDGLMEPAPWRGQLHFFIGVPLVVGGLAWLTAQNFRQLAPGGACWARNGWQLSLLLAGAVAVTSVVYHRFWEWPTAYEPPHGAARLTLAQGNQLDGHWYQTTARLPGGKLWYAEPTPKSVFNPLHVLLAEFKATMLRGDYLAGSNWLVVSHGPRDWVGIKTDGTLWVSPKPVLPVDRRWTMTDRDLDQPVARQLVQFGAETNWSSVGRVGHAAWLVKTDGTLWSWGEGPSDKKYRAWPGLVTFQPERLGTEGGWADVLNDYYMTCLRKTDGSVWARLASDSLLVPNSVELKPGVVFGCFSGPNHVGLRSVAMIHPWREYQVGVRMDGTFRILARERFDRKLERVRGSTLYWDKMDWQLGSGTNWVSVVATGNMAITLRDDGTLWRWDFRAPSRRVQDLEEVDHWLTLAKPARLGTHSDWIAISGEYEGMYALAADGTVWFWPLSLQGRINESEPLLDYSRKPQKVADVFESAAK